MKFEWDENKAQANFRKHGVSFEAAVTAFDDPYGRVYFDAQHSAWEMREWLLGESDVGPLVIVFTIRKPNNIFRIISARPVNKRERKLYEKIKRLSI